MVVGAGLNISETDDFHKQQCLEFRQNEALPESEGSAGGNASLMREIEGD